MDITKYLNLQAFHQLLTIAGVIQAGIAGIMTYAGCVATAAGGFDCTASTWDPRWIPWLMWGSAITVALKPLITIKQGGLRALVRPISVIPSRDDSGQFKAKK